MLKKLLVALAASAFALSVYAQAPQSGTEKAEPKGKTGQTTEKAKPKKGKSASQQAAKKPKAKTQDTKNDTKKDATK